MNCLLKNIPSIDFSIPGDGNRGIGFPLQSVCEVLPQPDAPPPPAPVICYLALEYGTDPLLSPITLVGYPDLSSTAQWSTLGEDPLSANSSWILAPCIAEVIFCYLALEEDGVTNFEMEENLDYFEVECP